MVAEVERDCIELGAEGRLLRMQLDELVGRVPEEKAAVVNDYHASDEPGDAAAALARLESLPYGSLLDLDVLSDLLGYPRGVNPLDHVVSPRGYRALAHIQRLPAGVIRRVVFGLDGLEAIVNASQRELEAVEGVGAVRAREIREGLRRLQEHNLVDRYLNL
jgi:diadenylate cyclase